MVRISSSRRSAGGSSRLCDRPSSNPAKARKASRTLGLRSEIQSALGHSHSAQERFIVGGIGDEPQIGEEVLHLAPLIEADGTNQAIRNARPPKCLFQSSRL